MSADDTRHPACSERLVWLRPAVDLMPASVVQLNPRPELKRDLMAVVREEAGEQEAPAPVAEKPRAAPRESIFTRVRRGLLGDGSLRPALVAVAAACLVAVGVAGYELGGSDSPGETNASFAATPTSPDVDGHGTVNVSGGTGSLFVEGMDEVAPNQVYQVWVAHGDTVEPSSIFVVDESGSGSASIPSIPEGADRVMITREPAGGSTQPRGEPVLSAEL